MEKNYKFKDIPYERMDFDEIQKKLDGFAAQIAQAKDYETVREILMESQKLQKEVSENQILAMIRMYQDSTDEFYAKESAFQEQKCAMLDSEKFNHALISSPFAENINQEFGTEFLISLDKDNRLFSNGKELQAKEQELMSRYQQLKAGMKFEFQGKTLSENEIRALREDQDRETRRESTAAMYRGYAAKKEEFAELLDELIKVRLAIAKANGFDSYLDYMNLEKGRREYGEPQLRAFCGQIRKEVVPLLEKLYEQQRERLGLEQMTVYDYTLVFPDGNPKPVGGMERLYEAARIMYHGLGADIGNFYDSMLEHELIDAEPSKNKIAGMGFCTELPKTGMPFVFANSNGTLQDVSVLTHEVGHAYQMYYSMKKQPLLEYLEMANDIVEIPSKTMEIFAYDYAETFFGKDAEKFLYMHQYDIVAELASYSMTDEYEAWLYTHPEASFEERCMEYDRLFQEFNPGIDNSEFAEEIRQGAVLSSNMGIFAFPKYLISYALSEMCALEFKERMETEKEQVWKDYKLLCETGGSLSYPELLKQSNLHPAYEEGAVARSIKGLKQRMLNN